MRTLELEVIEESVDEPDRSSDRLSFENEAFLCRIQEIDEVCVLGQRELDLLVLRQKLVNVPKTHIIISKCPQCRKQRPSASVPSIKLM